MLLVRTLAGQEEDAVQTAIIPVEKAWYSWLFPLHPRLIYAKLNVL